MDIIAKRAPFLDPQNLNESLGQFRDYMVEVLQVIDFTLSNQKNQISGAVSEQNFLQLAAAVQSLSSSLNAQNSTISSINTTVGNLGKKLESIEQRVSALENAP